MACSTETGRWQQIDCMAARSAFVKQACAASFRQRGRVHDLLNGSLFRGAAMWLPAEPQQERYDVLPLPMANRFWLHIEGDSSVMRAEKEELLWLLDDGDSKRVLSHPVTCVGLLRENSKGEPINAHYGRSTSACGSGRALQSILKHSHTHVNVYSFRQPRPATVKGGGGGGGGGDSGDGAGGGGGSSGHTRTRRYRTIFVSVSMAGGIAGNCATMGKEVTREARQCVLVGKCGPHANSTAGRRVLGSVGVQEELFASLGSSWAAHSPQQKLRRLCNSMPGVGTRYWSELSRYVGTRLVGAAAPDAVVMGYSGLHLVGSASAEREGHAATYMHRT